MTNDLRPINISLFSQAIWLAAATLFLAKPLFAGSLSQHLLKPLPLKTLAPSGQAEVALYRVSEIVQHKVRQGKMAILVEPLAQSGGELASKPTHYYVQLHKETPMGLGRWEMNSNVFLSSSSLELARLTVRSGEWGKVIQNGFDLGRLPASKKSGWAVMDGREAGWQRNLVFPVDGLGGATAYEALPLVVRLLDAKSGGFALPMVEPMHQMLIQPPRVGTAQVSFAPPTQINLYGKTYTVLPVTISHFMGEDTYWVDESPTRKLIKWNRYNGSEHFYRQSQPLDYWNRTRDTDIGTLEY